MNLLLQHISVDPNVCFGKPCIHDTRIWVSLLLDFLANGISIEEILVEYPQLTEEDVRASISMKSVVLNTLSGNPGPGFPGCNAIPAAHANGML